MEKRREYLLALVIDNYIKTAEPVGSRFLVTAGNLEVQEATVRNELRALEEDGYLTHPHTSAGRIPTEKGYRYYVDHCAVAQITPRKHEGEMLRQAARAAGNDEGMAKKNVAKVLAHLAEEAVIMAFSLDNVYYTGLTNLFSKPEFQETGRVINVSNIFDHCEDVLADFYELVGSDLRWFIGNEHPFGDELSVVASRFGKHSLVALLGPQRMDYHRNFNLMKKVIELVSYGR